MADLKNKTDRNKQEEYYYLERGQIHVNGCCTFEEGYYCGYHESKAPNYEMESWANPNTVKRVLRQLIKIKSKFKVQAQRDRVGEAIDDLYAGDAPFEYTYRFNLFSSFLRVNKLSKILGQISSAAAYKEDRDDEKGDAVTIPGSERKDTKKPDAKTKDWKYDDAAQQYNKGVEELEEIIASGMWSYTRTKFENELKILWCVGPPKCPVSKIQDDCPGNGGGNGSCPKPPPCNGTTYELSKLINLLNSKKPNGREADKWYVDVMDLTNPDCDVVTSLIKLVTLETNIKIPSFGFLFAPRNASSTDNKIYRVRFDLNSNTVKTAGEIDCDDLPT